MEASTLEPTQGVAWSIKDEKKRFTEILTTYLLPQSMDPQKKGLHATNGLLGRACYLEQ